MGKSKDNTKGRDDSMYWIEWTEDSLKELLKLCNSNIKSCNGSGLERAKQGIINDTLLPVKELAEKALKSLNWRPKKTELRGRPKKDGD